MGGGGPRSEAPRNHGAREHGSDMRIGELSRRTGVAVATIKYYVREGLLPPGELTSPNQARYGEGHERRLRLIRALISVGGLPVAQVREVLDAVTSPGHPAHRVLGAAQKSVTSHHTDATVSPEARERAAQRVAELLRARGWHAAPDHPAARTLADALATMEQLGHHGFPAGLDDYAAASEQIAAADIGGLSGGPEQLAETVIIGTLLGDTALVALRRLAQYDATKRRYGVGEPGDEACGGSDDAPDPE